MQPDDANGHKPPHERPLRVLLIAGSNRRQHNCPGVDSKARTLMLRMAERLPGDWEIDMEDLGNVYKRPQIQNCNACVSTSMALCVWPCNCYEKDSKAEPDLMWDLDLYARLDLADAWAFVAPVNWYGPTSTLKSFFDRLVCMNGGNPDETLIDHKDPEKAMALEQSPAWESLTRNHLEGRTAGFFCYGDQGGDELAPDGRPKILRHRAWFNPEDEPFENMRDAYAPLVWQCRYGGIEVPDDCWAYADTGVGLPYSKNQAEDMMEEDRFVAAFDCWSDAFADHVGRKGQVQPGEHRAFGYEPPSHRLDDLKLMVRDYRMRLGVPRGGSSPAAQQQAGLNRDHDLKRGRPTMDTDAADAAQ